MKNTGILIFTLLFALIFMFCDITTSSSNGDNDSIPPAVPTGLAIDVNVSIEDSIKFDWNENTDADFDFYRVYRSIDVDSPSQYAQVSETSTASHLEVGVDYGKTYYYRVSAVDDNDNESAMSDAVSHHPINIFAPAVPQNFTAYGYNIPAESAPRIDLAWSANGESDLAYYNVYRNTDRAFTADSAHFVTQTEQTQYSDLDVVLGQKYYYRVTAVDKGIMSSNPTSDKSDAPLPEPALFYPDSAGTTTTLHPAFEWQKIEGASSYKVILQTSFSSGEIWTGEVAQPTTTGAVSINYPGSPELTSNTNYYWKVAVYSSDNTSANTYSKRTWRFKTP